MLLHISVCRSWFLHTALASVSISDCIRRVSYQVVFVSGEMGKGGVMSGWGSVCYQDAAISGRLRAGQGLGQGQERAVQPLKKGLVSEDFSAIFRSEIAVYRSRQ